MANMWWHTFVQTLKTYLPNGSIKSQNHSKSPITFPKQVDFFHSTRYKGDDL